MKKFFSLLALSLLSASAFAETIQVDANEIAYLRDCGGTVRTNFDDANDRLTLVFKDVVNCSNFDIKSANGDAVNYPNKKLQGQDRSRDGSFTIPGSLIDSGKNVIRVVVQSNSGKTSDTIVIRIKNRGNQNQGGTGYVTMTSTDVKSLNICGGVVQTKVSNGDLNIIFKNVQNCSNFDIVAANGSSVDYPNQKLQGVDGARAGSFTLPSRVIQFLRNDVTVVLKSNSGKTSERIRIKFWSF